MNERITGDELSQILEDLKLMWGALRDVAMSAPGAKETFATRMDLPQVIDMVFAQAGSTPSHVERITPAELEHLIEWHDNCAKFSVQSDNFKGEEHHQARAAALRKVDELLCDIGARSAPSTTPRSEEAALAYKAFWDRHAKGSMLCPSCLMCGAPVAREQWAITHAELPDIFICACCVEKVRNPIDTPPSATPRIQQESDKNWLRAQRDVAEEKVKDFELHLVQQGLLAKEIGGYLGAVVSLSGGARRLLERAEKALSWPKQNNSPDGGKQS